VEFRSGEPERHAGSLVCVFVAFTHCSIPWDEVPHRLRGPRSCLYRPIPIGAHPTARHFICEATTS